jgi:MerR family transcriptional regulator, light-induced transcriptional regulator
VGRRIDCLGPFETPAQAAAALPGNGHVDAVLVQAPSLTAQTWPDIEAALPQACDAAQAVLYGYAASSTTEPLAAKGVALLREPQSDRALGQWLRDLLDGADAAHPADDDDEASDDIPQRRWTDAALADFAGLSSTVVCECPKHVAELLIQLSQFEVYSADCENRNADDAALHRHLWQVAAQARASFEDALEYVAMHEGLTLPARAA